MAEGRIRLNTTQLFALAETADVGLDETTPTVVEGIGEGRAIRSTGKSHQMVLK